MSQITSASERSFGSGYSLAAVGQWGDYGEGRFAANVRSEKTLPAGMYMVSLDDGGRLMFFKQEVITDELIPMPECQSIEDEIAKFWKSKEKFEAKKQVFKRGLLLHGPPGGGKTCLILLLAQRLIQDGGLVLYTPHIEFLLPALTQLRTIEPHRKIIVILEDVDDFAGGTARETMLLSLLDGETKFDNILYLATTNYPENLPKRLINRPSRFDYVVKVDLASDVTRRAFFAGRMAELSASELDTWVADTKGLSIAHLRELVVCVSCLGNDYADTVKRLLSMNSQKIGGTGTAVGF